MGPLGARADHAGGKYPAGSSDEPRDDGRISPRCGRIGADLMFGNRTDRRDRGMIRELAGAWIVTFLVVAFGLAVISHHVPDVRDHLVVPRWYDPSVAGAEPSQDERSGPRRI